MRRLVAIAVWVGIACLPICNGSLAWAQAEPTQIQIGQPQAIRGCGISGCYEPHRICVDVPAGATPIDIVAYHDSFAGWGDFGGKERTATGFCATYLQHSHNVTRIVSFDVSYRPAGAPPPTLPATERECHLAGRRTGLRDKGRSRNGGCLSYCGNTSSRTYNYRRVLAEAVDCIGRQRNHQGQGSRH
jgi:hypothetical protein